MQQLLPDSVPQSQKNGYFDALEKLDSEAPPQVSNPSKPLCSNLIVPGLVYTILDG